MNERSGVYERVFVFILRRLEQLLVSIAQYNNLIVFLLADKNGIMGFDIKRKYNSSLHYTWRGTLDSDMKTAQCFDGIHLKIMVSRRTNTQ